MAIPVAKKTAHEETLLQIRDAVLSETRPRAVYLFGSRARGDARQDSDYDILVVGWDTRPEPEITSCIRQRLRELSIRPHVVTATPETFEWRKRFANTIEHAAEHEGVVLYMADESEDRRHMASEWFRRALADFDAADLMLGHEGQNENVCFHIQQAVEKILKGYLTFAEIDAGKTHNIDDLLRLCSQAHPSFDMWTVRLRGMTEYAVSARYPGGRTIPDEEARQAVETAKVFREFVDDRIREIR